MLKKVGIEWNRIVDSRMVLIERHHFRGRSANHCRAPTGRSWVLSQSAAEGLCRLLVKSSRQLAVLV